jgi:hypothetical protein
MAPVKDPAPPKDKAAPPASGKGLAKTGREAALAEALRANLRRRKGPADPVPKKPR